MRTMRYVMARVRRGHEQEAIAHMQRTWKAKVDFYPFDYYFLDSDFDSAYRGAQQQVRLFAAAAGTAVLVACFGLFGLASFSAQQRTKEIGIRKALGGSTAGIVLLISREYAVLVGLASVLAWPIGHLCLRRWLEAFAYRVELGPGLFLASAGTALALAWVTVAWHAARAAAAKPVDALRNE